MSPSNTGAILRAAIEQEERLIRLYEAELVLLHRHNSSEATRPGTATTLDLRSHSGQNHQYDDPWKWIISPPLDGDDVEGDQQQPYEMVDRENGQIHQKENHWSPPSDQQQLAYRKDPPDLKFNKRTGLVESAQLIYEQEQEIEELQRCNRWQPHLRRFCWTQVQALPPPEEGHAVSTSPGPSISWERYQLRGYFVSHPSVHAIVDLTVEPPPLSVSDSVHDNHDDDDDDPTPSTNYTFKKGTRIVAQSCRLSKATPILNDALWKDPLPDESLIHQGDNKNDNQENAQFTLPDDDLTWLENTAPLSDYKNEPDPDDPDLLSTWIDRVADYLAFDQRRQAALFRKWSFWTNTSDASCPTAPAGPLVRVRKLPQGKIWLEIPLTYPAETDPGVDRSVSLEQPGVHENRLRGPTHPPPSSSPPHHQNDSGYLTLIWGWKWKEGRDVLRLTQPLGHGGLRQPDLDALVTVCGGCCEQALEMLFPPIPPSQQSTTPGARDHFADQDVDYSGDADDDDDSSTRGNGNQAQLKAHQVDDGNDYASSSDASSVHLSEYELMRLKRMARNRQRLIELGLERKEEFDEDHDGDDDDDDVVLPVPRRPSRRGSAGGNNPRDRVPTSTSHGGSEQPIKTANDAAIGERNVKHPNQKGWWGKKPRKRKRVVLVR